MQSQKLQIDFCSFPRQTTQYHSNPSLCILIKYTKTCVCAQSLQLGPSFWEPMDYSPRGSFVHGIFQAWILEWVAISPSGNLSDPGIKSISPASPALKADSLLLSHWGIPYRTYAYVHHTVLYIIYLTHFLCTYPSQIPCEVRKLYISCSRRISW